MPRVKNFHVSVKEINNKVIFLRKLVPGGTEHSFGIHVAKMAGMPSKVIDTANEILVQLEKSHSSEEFTKKAKEISKRNQQLRDFQLKFHPTERSFA